MQIVEQTKEEKLAMYMKLTKKELANMLIACNDLLDNIPPNDCAHGHHHFVHHTDYSLTAGGYDYCTKCGLRLSTTLTSAGTSESAYFDNLKSFNDIYY